MIRFSHVYKKYTEGNLALSDVSLDVSQGEFLYLIGPSGSGKSTIIKLLTCEERLTQGFLQIGNIDLLKLPDKKLPDYRRQIGVIPQDIFLLDHLTVYKNIVYSLNAIDFDRKKIKEKALAALSQVGMLSFKNDYPSELSIGQQQKVAIARAIVNNPKIILADEPTSNLDNKSSIEIMRILYKLNQDGATVLMATHNSTIVNTVRNRVLEIDNGELVRDQSNGDYGLSTDNKDIFII
ncbi:ATP-binding cassette domain-containing protein [Vagococcus fluvialis]|uniref:cell division ATP-binding protein FtsE n=1 Tax=Vagococcus fluvialis TaxID=2738 RepID=UPI0014332BC7|nr:ATP-binding cassette domain-containing protein [Vagococcus fluvialis]MBO0485855.1 ATP-binding cassette domain-containing protein [Vagococcus fluvialis]NKC59611.1 ATP-binding cassette domain-containing protein [Vagococcus fluvialis]NKD50589.1 ATP-binding cassette domain-containing protein [Vagococcus fluvialis]